ncbi:MAG: glycosyltransferase family 4 protein, partial [Anaerolineae bacterium]|nr:glycosyltransferase family 4 protein [Anaerolineae bacterium]
MHILVPTGIFHPESGGPATYLYRFLPELLQRGHTVEVVTFGEGQTESYPYPVTRIPRTSIFHRNWLYYRAVKEKLPRADMVFINSLGIPLPRIQQPAVLKIVGDRAWERAVNRGWIPPTEDIDHFQTAPYGIKVSYVKYSRSRESRRVRQVIVPSHYLRKMVIEWGVPAERVKTIYNAIESLSSEPVTRQALHLPEGKPLLLTAARLTAWKGVDRILNAIAALPDVMLVVAGDGPMLAALKQQAEVLSLTERVRFLGKTPHSELAKYYQVADYTILYSGYEGLSHVLLESLSAGTPVIASDKCGNPELVRDGQNGFLAPYPVTRIPR